MATHLRAATVFRIVPREVLNNSKLSERLVAELMGKANDDRESLTWTLHMSREFLDEIRYSRSNKIGATHRFRP